MLTLALPMIMLDSLWLQSSTKYNTPISVGDQTTVHPNMNLCVLIKLTPHIHPSLRFHCFDLQPRYLGPTFSETTTTQPMCHIGRTLAVCLLSLAPSTINLNRCCLPPRSTTFLLGVFTRNPWSILLMYTNLSHPNEGRSWYCITLNHIPTTTMTPEWFGNLITRPFPN